MKDLEYLSDYRNKRIGKDLDKQIMKHLELLCINAELVQTTGSTSQKMRLIESLRKINNFYLSEDY
jgi:soluble P-type ATPase